MDGVEVKLVYIVSVQVRTRFCVDLLVDANDGRLDVEAYFAASAVVTEHERSGGPGGEEFGVDGVAELGRERKEGVCTLVAISVLLLFSANGSR